MRTRLASVALTAMLTATASAIAGCAVNENTNSNANTAKVDNVSGGGGVGAGASTRPAGASAGAAGGAGSSPGSGASSAGQSSQAYTTSAPFPLCDTAGASWTLIGASPADCSGNTGIIVNGNNIVLNKPVYGYATATSFPGGIHITASNTVTVVGTLPGTASGYHTRCFGIVEGASAGGYFGYLCNDGNWYVKSLLGMSSSNVSVGAGQVATGMFPFTAGTSYQLSLAFKANTLAVSISLGTGSASPITSNVPIGAFAPTSVGTGYVNTDYNLPIDPSGFYSTISGFVYSMN